VPFFLGGPSAICRGRGEVVEKAGRPAIQWVLLVLWPRPMPTAQVYLRFDDMGLGRESNLNPEPPWDSWLELTSRDLLPKLVNDLESAAFAIDPELGQARAESEQKLGRPLRMSGSGSSLFSLYDTEAQAREAARLLMQQLNVQALVVELAPHHPDSLNDEKSTR
jgi:4-diphosphocytidyl-2-C-methyl-D-erythritol kinase